MADPLETEGQVTTDSTGTTEASPNVNDGQSVAGDQTTSGPDSTAPELFFDPADLSEDLQPAYKQMQAAFTKKMTGLGENQHMIDAYRAFEANPQAALKNLAQQYGVQLMPGQPNAEEPQTWDDVYSRAKQDVMKDLQPLISEIQQMKKNNLESVLDSSCPDWRIYEDSMMSTLQKHPTLVNDPARLYQMSVPSEVLESRATQKALKKLQQKTENSQTSGGSTTTKTASNMPSGPMSFNDAVKAAKAKLASEGRVGI